MFEIARHSLLIFPVNAGLTFNGDEKNCEKLGSCPDAGEMDHKQHITISDFRFRMKAKNRAFFLG
jgi:hypothetical protein